MFQVLKKNAALFPDSPLPSDSLGLLADYEHATGRAAATDVQHREGPSVFDLILTGLMRDLSPAIQHLAYARRSYRMACTDQSSGRINGALAPQLDDAAFDCLPRFAGLGQSEMIDRHVFRGREAIVCFNSGELFHAGDPRTPERIENRLPGMREHIRVVLALGNLRIEFEGSRVMSPAENPWNIAQALVVTSGPLAGELFRGEKQRDAAIRDLGTIAHFDPSADDGIELRLLLGMALAHEPVAGLRVGIAFGVGIVHRRNVRQVFVLEPKALVIFVAQAAEQLGKWKLDALRFAFIPCRGAEVVAAGRGIDSFHLLDAGNAGEIVPTGLDLGGGGENRDRTRRARGLMAGGR